MKVNGSYIELEVQKSVYDFLTEQDYDLKTVAVERNGEIVPKATYKSVMLENQDHIEIVRFVGGG